MSHIALIKTQITDLEAVKLACAELGLTFLENQTTCKFWPNAGTAQEHPCTHAIGLPKGNYCMELGLVRTATGYDLVGDELLKWDEKDDSGYNWTRSLMGRDRNPLGVNFGKLLQSYGVNKATIEAKRRGYMVSRQYVPNTQTIQLVVTGV